MRTVLVEYVLSPSASVVEVEREIADFVRGIRELGVGIRYTSHRRQKTERAYVHVGHVPSDAALAALQAAPFFGKFASALRAACVEGPRTTWLDVVATTESSG